MLSFVLCSRRQLMEQYLRSYFSKGTIPAKSFSQLEQQLLDDEEIFNQLKHN